MKITRKYIRKLIIESLEKRIAFANDMVSLGLTPKEAQKKGILNMSSLGNPGVEELQPMGSDLFNKKAIYQTKDVEKEEMYMGKPLKYTEEEEELFMGAMEAIRAATKRGRLMKQLFRKYADSNFMNQLILIHYTTPEAVLRNVKANKSNVELSAVALLPFDFTKDKIGVKKTAIILDGHVTYFANNQDDVYSGKVSDYVKAFAPQKGYEPFMDDNMYWEDKVDEKEKAERPYVGSDRTKSSGVNKSVANIRSIERFKSPSMSRSNYLQRPGREHIKQVPKSAGSSQTSYGEPPIVLDKEDYLPRFDQSIGSSTSLPGNEALIDNWTIKAIILNWGAENEKYKEMFRAAGYEGKIMTFDEAVADRNNLINQGHKA